MSSNQTKFGKKQGSNDWNGKSPFPSLPPQRQFLTSETNQNDQNKKISGHQVLEIIMESTTESTTHGLGHMFKRDNICIRLFWLVCFLISAAVCGYMIAMSIISYLEYETVTKSEKVFAVSTDFPQVSICNMNAFLTNESVEFVSQLLAQNQLNDPAYFNTIFADTFLILQYFAGTNALNPNLTDDFRKSLGYQFKDILLSCTYNLVPCTVDDFVWYYDILHGNCFKFNSGKYANGSTAPIIKSTRSGLVNGLTVELFLYDPTNVMSLATSTGAHIFVSNQTDLPLFTDGLNVASGTFTNIEVTRVFSSHIEKPYSDCIADINPDYSQLVKAIFSTGYTYAQENCFLACYQRYLVDQCNCFDTSVAFPVELLTDRKNVKACLTLNDTVCNSIQYGIFFSLDVNANCGKECPLECEAVDYNLATNQAEYPAKVYANLLMNNPKIQAKYASNPSDLSYDSLKRNMAQVSVYYGDLGYQKYEESEKTSLSDLVAIIGGTLGLFLGMSFLSFIEIADVVLQIFFLRYSKNNHNTVSP